MVMRLCEWLASEVIFSPSEFVSRNDPVSSFQFPLFGNDCAQRCHPVPMCAFFFFTEPSSHLVVPVWLCFNNVFCRKEHRFPLSWKSFFLGSFTHRHATCNTASRLADFIQKKISDITCNKASWTTTKPPFLKMFGLLTFPIVVLRVRTHCAVRNWRIHCSKQLEVIIIMETFNEERSQERRIKKPRAARKKLKDGVKS